MTTNLNPQFMLQSSLQEVFRDKDTGLPLRSGYVDFFKDQDRITPKNIYKLSGSPGSYSYVPLPNRVPLTGIGTTSDAGVPANDIPWYYYPYDDNGDIELYYARVYNSLGVFQFDRQAWPNFAGQGSVAEDILNYIPNGQFLLHTNIPEDSINEYAEGEIRQPITDIAQGGWTFERPSNSSATDIVTFEEIGSFTTNPTASPRFVFRLQTQVTSPGDSYKDIRIKFSDVNKFSSDEQNYTFGFEGQSNSSSSIEVTLVLIKNFGTGGSPTTETVITTFQLTDTFSLKQFSFEFGSNSGKTIGPLNDDFLQLAIRFKTNSLQDISLTNFVDTPNIVTLIEFPQTTDKDFSDRSLVLNTPSYDGNDFGLPIVITKKGLSVDHSVVGQIIHSINSTEDWSFLCDGSQLLTSGYQDNGVPNSRLQNVLFNIDPAKFRPIYGTGLNFVTALGSTVTSNMIFHTNSAGTVTQTSDGAISTGFSFSQYSIGHASYGVSSPWWAPSVGDGNFIIWNDNYGNISNAGAGNSGFSVSVIRMGRLGGTGAVNDEIYGGTSPITSFTTTNAAGLASKYITFVTTTTSYYVWFKVDGSGTDPAPGGTGILINLLSTDTADFVAAKISNGINGFEGSLVIVTAGSSITPGSYFNFNAFGGSTTAYYVWYKVDGAGVDPFVIGRFGIEVNILSTDNSDIVENKTVIAINSVYYALPDFRGQLLRGNDPTKIYDKGQRFSLFNDNIHDGIGSFELDSNLSHQHSYRVVAGGTGIAEGASSINSQSQLDGASGGTESIGYNTAINFFIHY